MTQRIDFMKVSPSALKGMFGLQAAVDHSSLEHSLVDLVKLRASQINHCAYCIDMHFKDAKARGETEQRLYMLDAWRESPFYSDRERAALAWCESLTLISETGAPDDVFAEVREHFNDEELANLSLAIVAINSWNRLMVGFRAEPGHYQPGSAEKMKKALLDRQPMATSPK
jgi:AhpD family alkylhydroperoxidase